MPETKYLPMPCGLKREYEVAGDISVVRQRAGACPHANHAGDLVFDDPGGATLGWRCEEHTSEAGSWPRAGQPGTPPWRRIRRLDDALIMRSQGKQGWEYVTPLGGDA